MRFVVGEGAGGGEGRAGGGAGCGVEVGLVAGERVPRAGVVVGHEVPEVEGGVHGLQVQVFVVLRAGGTGGREEEAVAVVAGGVGVEG